MLSTGEGKIGMGEGVGRTGCIEVPSVLGDLVKGSEVNECVRNRKGSEDEG